MRELKFRAWHRAEKCWHYFELIGVKAYPELESSESRQYQNRCVWTGLLDRNGKGDELYSGDILKDDSSPGNFERDYPQRGVGVIVWDDSKAAFCLEWQDRMGHKMRPLLHEMISRYNHKIGNIYEHPELIKEDSDA